MPVQTESISIPYTVSHRSIKHPRLEFNTGSLLVVLPEGQDENRIIEKHRKWIERKYAYINEITNKSQPLILENRSREEFQTLVKSLIEIYSGEVGCCPNRLVFRHLRTKWASCSRKGNLTINYLAKDLPESLIQYILYHEMVHLIHSRHDYLFWKYLETKFNNIEEIEIFLCSYWVQINRINHLEKIPNEKK